MSSHAGFAGRRRAACFIPRRGVGSVILVTHPITASHPAPHHGDATTRTKVFHKTSGGIRYVFCRGLSLLQTQHHDVARQGSAFSHVEFEICAKIDL